MKLVYAIVNNDDSHSVMEALTENGFMVTKLASTGGFLKAGNTTFLICSEDEKVCKIINIIKDKSHKRKQLMPVVSTYEMGAIASMPIEVTVGGATIFVTDIERFEKV